MASASNEESNENLTAAAATSKSDDTNAPEEMEYETQFFRFGPKALYDEIYNTIVENVQKSLGGLKKEVLDQDWMLPVEVSEAFGLVEGSIVQKMNSEFIRLEQYMASTIMGIPPNVCLPEDEPQEDERLESINKSELAAEIKELEQKLAKAQLVKGFMDDELKIIDSVREGHKEKIEELRDVLEKAVYAENRRKVEGKQCLDLINALKFGGGDN